MSDEKRPTDEEVQSSKQAERDAENAEHLARVGGANPERISSAEDTDRQLQETINEHNKARIEEQNQ